jgi:energy-coupling factor transporter ATP-binding protein EcfA2
VIIYFFGPDGAGKTTLVQALASNLRVRHTRVKVSWLRGTHTLASRLAYLLRKSEVFRGSNNPYYGIRIPRNLTGIWQCIEFLSALPIVLFRFTLPAFLGFTVIGDRYVLDFVVWVSLTTEDPNYLKSFLARFLLSLGSKERYRILVTAPFEELSNRKKDEVPPEFLMSELRAYENLARTIRAYKLDTSTKNLEGSLNDVMRILDFDFPRLPRS